ncbi:hypothetical protein NE237_000230 [Protea cynaroides]|uniref:Uncharacterized protein n=1 Tax=Protea cynaroides TaxID=273540 RepID=A0A9Q0KR56_9MAGN|nr:hypothetical protein NE237_000230 [Protea cynaroides]
MATHQLQPKPKPKPKDRYYSEQQKQQQQQQQQQQIHRGGGIAVEEDQSNKMSQPDLYGNRYFCGQKIMCGGTKFKIQGKLRAGNLNPAYLPPQSSSSLPSIYYENQTIMGGGEHPTGEFESNGIIEMGNMG